MFIHPHILGVPCAMGMKWLYLEHLFPSLHTTHLGEQAAQICAWVLCLNASHCYAPLNYLLTEHAEASSDVVLFPWVVDHFQENTAPAAEALSIQENCWHFLWCLSWCCWKGSELWLLGGRCPLLCCAVRFWSSFAGSWHWGTAFDGLGLVSSSSWATNRDLACRWAGTLLCSCPRDQGDILGFCILFIDIKGCHGLLVNTLIISIYWSTL